MQLLDDPGLYVRGVPHALYDERRRSCPVCFNPGTHPFFALTRHEDAVSVLSDARTYSSWLGGISIEDPLPEMLPFMRAMLPARDPPDHTRLRERLLPPLTAERLAALRADIAKACDTLIEAALACGDVDFVQSIAAELPLLVLGSFMGLDRPKLEPLRALSDVIIEQGSNASAEAFRRLFEYLDALIGDRLEHPREDYMTLLAQVDTGEQPMSRLERNGMLMQILIGGLETTRSAMAGMLIALIDAPGQWELLRGRADLIVNAVEESLRLVSPVNYVRRTTTRPTALGDVEIPTGSRVVVLLGAANRDPQRFEAPHRFDVRRSNVRQHLALGAGVHFCLGAALARMQLQAFWSSFLQRVYSFALRGPWERVPVMQQNAVRALPVRLTAVG